MNEVRLRSRRSTAKLAASARVREIQGMLAMRGLELETEPTQEAGRESIQTGPSGRPSEIKPLPYRQVLANWSEDWRRWGRRTPNALEESGLHWRDAEGRAFVEIWSQLKAASQTERN